MPTEYKRKNAERASWSAEALQNAIESVKNGTMGVKGVLAKFQR
jgi:hypothetical protein